MKSRPTGTRLDPILEAVRERAAKRRAHQPLESLRRELLPEPARRERFRSALAGEGLAILAECKRRSPSVGALSGELDLAERAAAYAAGGAAALSILTEQDHFDGHPRDLAAVEGAGLPRLRKDFILDEGMVLESVAMGADAILLLAICLPGSQLAELRACAREAGLAVLLEVHDAAELERAAPLEPEALGINARDLRSFEVDLARVIDLLPRVPSGPLRIAESGLGAVGELRRVAAAGADGALVGEALMRSPDPARTLREWREALGG